MGASGGTWSGSADGLVGRDDDLELLHRLLSEGSRTALLLGLPGAGKTAVLDHASRSASADGWRVLRVVGHAADRDLPYTALLDLVRSTPAADGDDHTLEQL